MKPYTRFVLRTILDTLAIAAAVLIVIGFVALGIVAIFYS